MKPASQGVSAALQVVVMCKAPVAGQVKTRLISKGIDAATACDWHRQMASVVIDRAERCFPARVTVAADDVRHPFFSRFPRSPVAQGSGNLGARLLRLAQARIADGPILFLGTDSPHMTTARLLQAVGQSSACDAVIGPVEDGGYDLILLANCKALTLLEQIDWGTGYVCEQTTVRAQNADIRLGLLPVGFDVDAAEDLQRSLLLGWG
ncbi:MAG: glycosyltransferase [Mariprofundales bacterium]